MCKDRTLMCSAQGPKLDARAGQVIRVKQVLDIAHYVAYSMFHTV
jgi:hypothetical protein